MFKDRTWVLKKFLNLWRDEWIIYIIMQKKTHGFWIVNFSLEVIQPRALFYNYFGTVEKNSFN